MSNIQKNPENEWRYTSTFWKQPKTTKPVFIKVSLFSTLETKYKVV